jgi:small glutamine-rich tetratricopeptide repeat-containing protein alpha
MGGSGGPGGGMPDLGSLMNNPQLMAAAQQMAANGGLANLMQNPAIANMVFEFSSSSGL